MSHLKKIVNSGLLPKGQLPKHLPDSLQYETIMGSVAYGVSQDNSDFDVVGFCIPEKVVIFPHLAGYIPGFGTQPDKFDQWQKHHIDDPENNRVYDFTIYNIVKYFSLCAENNPNMVETLFTPQNAILHCSPIAQMVREKRKIFLHKGAWHKFKGYAFSQMHKMNSKEAPTGKRKESVDKYGFDVKFAYHVVRLIDECQMILEEGDLDLQRNKEKLKAIRRGEWKLEDIKAYFEERERALEKLYAESNLPHGPREPEIKQLLMDCLEHHYGNLKDAIVKVDAAEVTVQQIKNILSANGY